MCEFCGKPDCTLTKQQAVRHGAILERNAYAIMRGETGITPRTYAFHGIKAYNSYSALIPDENDENPHAYLRFVFDEDEGEERGWDICRVQNPLAWQTEEEFLKTIR